MGRKIEVKMHCAKKKGSFFAIFEEGAPKEWSWVESKKIIPPSAKKSSFLERFGLLKTTTPPQTQEATDRATSKVEGNYYLGTGTCPYCGNGSFLTCRCGLISCYPIDSSYFECSFCDFACTTVCGPVSDLSANSTDEGTGADEASLTRSNGSDNNYTLR